MMGVTRTPRLVRARISARNGMEPRNAALFSSGRVQAIVETAGTSISVMIRHDGSGVVVVRRGGVLHRILTIDKEGSE